MVQRVKNIYHLCISFISNIYYGFPGKKLIVIGVTGTSGKTTTSHMIYEVLKSSGNAVSLISSIKAIIGGEEIDTGFHVTTPSPHILPKYLNLAVTAHDKYVVLEVSSHALDQHRASFIPFRIGVLTTLSHEHLDYHKTFLNYAKAKFKLLHASVDAIIPEGKIPTEILQEVKLLQIKRITTFGINIGMVNQKQWKLNLSIPGEYNLLNALAAAAVGTILELPKKEIVQALESFSSLPGRFEEIKNKYGFKIFIDFAHKPDALTEVLKTANKLVSGNGRIIVMFGCASQRDVLKRPMMGKICGEMADITVLTDEDPRMEDPEKIISEIAMGCEEVNAKKLLPPDVCSSFTGHCYYQIPNRKKAIFFIIHSLARKNDVILFCGKGHERSMNYRGTEMPWNEQEVVKQAVASYEKK